ncbi:MAG: hypothetical protein REI94_01290 [Moraxellaceae bacterium]|nr:hypothetical protein [Moraxellaceae bacterium]
MLILRFVGLILLVAIAVCAAAYLFTRDRRYLNWALKTFKVGVAVALVFLALMVLERFLAPMV